MLDIGLEQKIPSRDGHCHQTARYGEEFEKAGQEVAKVGVSPRQEVSEQMATEQGAE
jgi:hypothetical protein